MRQGSADMWVPLEFQQTWQRSAFDSFAEENGKRSMFAWVGLQCMAVKAVKNSYQTQKDSKDLKGDLIFLSKDSKKASKRMIMIYDNIMSCLLMPHPKKESKGFLAFKDLSQSLVIYLHVQDACC